MGKSILNLLPYALCPLLYARLWWAVLDFLRFTQDKLTLATVLFPALTRPNTAASRLLNWWAVLDSNQRLSA
jgi:hypothetical protein